MKKRFYKIAVQPEAPIVITFPEDTKKRGGILKVFYLTGNYEKDLAEIEQYDFDKTADYPEILI